MRVFRRRRPEPSERRESVDGATILANSESYRNAQSDRRRIVKFHLATASGNVVTGLGPGWVRIGAIEYRENLVLTPEAIATGWAPAGFDGLAEADFARLLSLQARGRAVRRRAGDPLSASAPHARADRRAHRARGDGHAGRVPDVQHPRGGGARRRGRVAADVSARRRGVAARITGTPCREHGTPGA